MKFSPFTYLPSIKITSKLVFKTGTLNSIIVNQQRHTVQCVHKKTKPTTFLHNVIKPQLNALNFGTGLKVTTASAYTIMSYTSPA